MKVADYVLDFIVSLNIRHIFGLIGGTCGILIDRLGEYQKQGQLRFVPMLHEQSCSIAVEGYARIQGFGVAIVSSGPAVTNIMTGVLGAFHDSIPCLYIAGQQDLGNIYRDFEHDERDVATADRVDRARHRGIELFDRRRARGVSRRPSEKAEGQHHPAAARAAQAGPK